MSNFEDFNVSPSEGAPSPAPGSNNRVFVVLISLLVLIFLAAVALMGAYVLFIRPQAAAQRTDAMIKTFAENTATAMAINAEATEQSAAGSTATLSVIAQAATLTQVAQGQPGYPPAGMETPQPNNTATRSSLGATNTPVVLYDARTATVAALLTQAAQGQPGTQNTPGTQGTPQATSQGGAGLATATPTATALPKTGFAEDVGIPGLLGITVVLIGVILVVRRLRTAS